MPVVRTLEMITAARDAHLQRAEKFKTDGYAIARQKFEELTAYYDTQYSQMISCAERDFKEASEMLARRAANPPKEYISRALARRINLQDDPAYVEALRAAKKENPDLDPAAFWAKWQKDHPVTKVKPTAESKKKGRVVKTAPAAPPAPKPTPAPTTPSNTVSEPATAPEPEISAAAAPPSHSASAPIADALPAPENLPSQNEAPAPADDTNSVADSESSESSESEWFSDEEAELAAAKERQRALLFGPAPAKPAKPAPEPPKKEESQPTPSNTVQKTEEEEDAEAAAWLAAQAAARAEKARIAAEKEKAAKAAAEAYEKALADPKQKAKIARENAGLVTGKFNPTPTFYTPPQFEEPPHPRIIASTKKLPKAVRSF